jgi:hypothetical protein
MSDGTEKKCGMCDWVDRRREMVCNIPPAHGEKIWGDIYRCGHGKKPWRKVSRDTPACEHWHDRSDLREIVCPECGEKRWNNCVECPSCSRDEWEQEKRNREYWERNPERWERKKRELVARGGAGK